MKNLNLLFALAFMAFATVFAQETTIKGTVTDEKKPHFLVLKSLLKEQQMVLLRMSMVSTR